MNITVYLGSSYGNDPDFKNKIIELGNWIGTHHHILVYGGSKTGLMGELAHSVLQADGKVIGVEAQRFVDENVQMNGLTQLYIEKNIANRRTKMIELGQAFIAFPGGTGTLEEISEILSKIALNEIQSPCIFYNVNGYYNHLKAFLNHMIECGLSTKEKQENVFFVENLEQIENILKQDEN